MFNAQTFEITVSRATWPVKQNLVSKEEKEKSNAAGLISITMILLRRLRPMSYVSWSQVQVLCTGLYRVVSKFSKAT